MSEPCKPTLASMQQAWDCVIDKVVHACWRAGRDPESVQVLLVTKGASVDHLLAAYDAGARLFGVNYVQQGQALAAQWQGVAGARKVDWDFIGQLQSNKVNKVWPFYRYIHSVDRLSLMQALSSRSAAMPKVPKVLVQVNVAQEQTKCGIFKEELRFLLDMASDQSGVEIVGLMTFPPFEVVPENNRRWFAQLRELADQVNSWSLPRVRADILSMGVSHDFEIAIEEGANIVRIGQAILGHRSIDKLSARV